ncbi:MAG: phosphonate C-P lyase system protein PhnG [Lachnospiraceae bacterium]|nr:phosphonate C-P lyase system protein PhnG [Lachnospiraceae bacterium]
MDKKRLFRIMAKASDEEIRELASDIIADHTVMVIKEPAKTLAMIKMQEPVKESLFYIGEVIVCEAVVMVDGTRGMAVTMGDHFEKVYHMAVIDAACNQGIFAGEKRLMELEEQQITREEKENAMHLKTMVNFQSMDSEVG